MPDLAPTASMRTLPLAWSRGGSQPERRHATARAASFSPAYLSKLENDAIKKSSPHVLRQFSACPEQGG